MTQSDFVRDEAGEAARDDAPNGAAADGDIDLSETDYAGTPDDIPPRGWLLGNPLCRQFLTGIFGDGATRFAPLGRFQWRSNGVSRSAPLIGCA
jgi:hypothetical protein